LSWLKLVDSPVVEIVMQVSITDSEFKFFKELTVIVNIKSIENIIIFLFG
jgi:hypothetical protein